MTESVGAWGLGFGVEDLLFKDVVLKVYRSEFRVSVSVSSGGNVRPNTHFWRRAFTVRRC